MAEEKQNRTMEVIKFAFSVGIPLAAFAFGYGTISEKVTDLETSDSAQNVEIKNLHDHDVQSALETIQWRTNTTNQIQNIEKLTVEIHDRVVPQ